MNLKLDLIEIAISINKQMENFSSAKLFVKDQLAKDHYNKEPEI